jgi:hypothetical protein
MKRSADAAMIDASEVNDLTAESEKKLAEPGSKEKSKASKKAVAMATGGQTPKKKKAVVTTETSANVGSSSFDSTSTEPNYADAATPKVARKKKAAFIDDADSDDDVDYMGSFTDLRASQKKLKKASASKSAPAGGSESKSCSNNDLSVKKKTVSLPSSTIFPPRANDSSASTSHRDQKERTKGTLQSIIIRLSDLKPILNILFDSILRRYSPLQASRLAITYCRFCSEE